MSEIMMEKIRNVEHATEIGAPAGEVYRLLADAERWPQLLAPSIHVECVETTGQEECLRIWASANGGVKTWTSRRVLMPDDLRIEFRQEVSAHPVAAMRGTWIVEPTSGQECRLRLLHTYSAVDDDPDDLAWIDKAVDENSRSELAGLKAAAEAAAERAELTLTFVDSIRFDGAADDVFDFINEADKWTQRLPHVASVGLTEAAPGVQTLTMETQAPDGSTHVTESVRVCFARSHIVYKQTTLPALMELHTGRWTFEEDQQGVTTASSEHTVVIRPEQITPILGPDAGIAQALEYLRHALGNNSRATLEKAREFAQARR